VHLKLGKINLYLGNYQQAISNIRDAVDVLKITHGEHSHMMRDIVNPLLLNAQAQLAESQRIAALESDEDDDDDEDED